MPLAKIVSLGNTPIHIIPCMGTITHLHSRYLQALRSLITCVHSIYLSVRNLPAAQGKDFKLIGHHAQDIWPAQSWLWWVSNVPPSAVFRTRAIISRCTKITSRTAGKSSSQSDNIFQLDSSTSISFKRNWETLHKPTDGQIPAASRTMENRYRRICRLAPVGSDDIRWMWCSRSERWFVGLGPCRRQTPNQPEANRILIEAICENDGAGQL